MPFFVKHFLVFPAIFFAAGLTPSLRGADLVDLRRDGREIHLRGQILVEAQDGGLLLLAPDGVLWAVQPEERLATRSDGEPFELLRGQELIDAILAELPEGFEVHQTAHYLIFHNTSKAYAQWCGALYERLYRVFFNFWTTRQLDLKEPSVPLIAVVFKDQTSYADYSREELGDAAGSIIGYYSLRTNRIVSYDLTGTEQFRRPDQRVSTAAHVNQILSRGDADRTVATIIHEATHQLSYNSGMFARYADIPLWVSEGVAIFFETPDLESSRGWRSIGQVPSSRLEQFRRMAPHRASDSFVRLTADDERFRQADSALDAYAEAWALTYYLLQKHSDQYIAYLRDLSEKRPLFYDTPSQRMQLLQKHFGTDLRELDRDFFRQTLQLRPN